MQIDWDQLKKNLNEMLSQSPEPPIYLVSPQRYKELQYKLTRILVEFPDWRPTPGSYGIDIDAKFEAIAERAAVTQDSSR